MSISLILAESALEVVPQTIRAHPAVASHVRRTGSPPERMLLDVSWHYDAMKNLADSKKRGRPDLVHLAMLSAMSAPIYHRHDMLAVYVHTIADDVIYVGPCVRMPKSYHRFVGLAESLYHNNATNTRRHKSGGRIQIPLMRLQRGQTFGQLVAKQKFSKVIGLSSAGVMPESGHPFEAVAENIMNNSAGNSSSSVAVVIGGFQRGHFSDRILDYVDELYAVDPHPLEAHVVIARILYECEKQADFLDA